jgi:hypothetical protein
MGSGNRTGFRLSVVLTACRVYAEYFNLPWECFFELKILSFFEVHLSFFCLLMIQFVFRRKQYKTKQQWPTQSCWCSPGRSPSPEPTQTMNLLTSAWRYLALHYILFLWRLTGSAILCRGSWFYKGCHGFNARFPVKIIEINNGISFICHNNLIHGIQYLGAVMRIRIQDPGLFWPLDPGWGLSGSQILNPNFSELSNNFLGKTYFQSVSV